MKDKDKLVLVLMSDITKEIIRLGDGVLKVILSGDKGNYDFLGDRLIVIADAITQLANGLKERKGE